MTISAAHAPEVARPSRIWCHDSQGSQFGFDAFLDRITVFHGYPSPGLVIAGKMVDLALEAMRPGVLFDAITETHQRDVFELTDAVGERKLSRALSFLHNLIQNGQPPPLIVHMLARHFRILSKAREIEGRMMDRAEIARYLGVNPFYANNYVRQAKNFSRQELRKSFQKLSRCDREIKSSRLPRERVLERAIISITEHSS